jgi:putative flippase GtrA
LNQVRDSIIAFIDFFHRPFTRWIDERKFRYLACGGSNTVFGLVLYNVSFHHILRERPIFIGSFEIHSYIAASGLSLLVTLPTGFLLSKFIVFQESSLHSRIQLFRYALLIGTCTFLNYVFMKIFVELCHFYPTPSAALSAVFVAIFSYITQRYFTFKVKTVVE